MNEDSTAEPVAKRPKRVAMPPATSERAKAAINRHLQRFATPALEVSGNWNDWTFGNPYREEDLDNWHALIFEAFGTRSYNSAKVFIRQLARLVGNRFDQAADEWRPKLQELNAAINIVGSVQPANEQQAALAVQLVALHLSAMGLASRCAASCSDERTAATLARVAKACASLAATIAALQGARTTRHEAHVHYHKHGEQHVHMGEGQDFGGQPHAHKEIGVDGEPQGSSRVSALPSPCQDNRKPMPLAGRQREAGLPNAWRAILRRTFGRG